MCYWRRDKLVERKHIIRAGFFRSSTQVGIEVNFPDVREPYFLSELATKFSARVLSDMELAEVIGILTCEKVVMENQQNFPPVYAKMLSQLCELQTERYGVKEEV